MVTSSKQKNFSSKKESDCLFNIVGNNTEEITSGSRRWSGLNDPRIVRVSRSFRGKDRHSKVRTVRGLRDRRIRLSTPTATQIYELQDRLGFKQPSKVVEWLIKAAEQAIDKLPPLQMSAVFLAHDQVTTSKDITSSSFMFANSEFLRSGAHSLGLLSSKGELKNKNDMSWNPSDVFGASSKDVLGRDKTIEKGKWIKRNEHEHQGILEVPSAQKWVQSSLTRPGTHSLLTGPPNNIVMPFTSYYHLELPANASLSHLGGNAGSSQVDQEFYIYNGMPLPSTLLASGPQLLFYPSGTTHSIIPSYLNTMAFDPKHTMNHKMLSSTSQNLLPNSSPTAGASHWSSQNLHI